MPTDTLSSLQIQGGRQGMVMERGLRLLSVFGAEVQEEQVRFFGSAAGGFTPSASLATRPSAQARSSAPERRSDSCKDATFSAMMASQRATSSRRIFR